MKGRRIAAERSEREPERRIARRCRLAGRRPQAAVDPFARYDNRTHRLRANIRPREPTSSYASPMSDSTPELSFRPLENGDYSQTVELWSRCTGIGQAEPPELFSRFLLRNPGCSQSAWAGERLVGAVLVGFDGKRAYCYHLAVDPAFRRYGIAKTMLSRALKVVQQEGVEKATIFLLRDNAVGRAFWEGLNWIERDDLVIFQMPLDDSDASSC